MIGSLHQQLTAVRTAKHCWRTLADIATLGSRFLGNLTARANQGVIEIELLKDQLVSVIRLRVKTFPLNYHLALKGTIMKNNITKIMATVVLALGMNAMASAQQTVSFVENTTDAALAGLGAGGYVDIFYTQSADPAEYLNHDLIVNATVGGILDPIRGSGGGQADGTGLSVDTWTHTVFEIFVANSSSYVFTTYDPVGAFPTFTGDSLPATALNWSVFDTNGADTDVQAPYHLGRVLYTAGGAGTIDFLVFDTVTVGAGGENFSTPYGGGVIPEPTTLALAGLSLLGLVSSRRRRS